MAKQHDNRYTTPPFNEAEMVAKFKALLPDPTGGEEQKNWVKLFIGYIRSTTTEAPSLKAYLAKHGASYPAVQSRGTPMFWNRARRAVQGRALAKAMDKSVDIVAEKYEKQLRIVGKLEDAIEHRVDAIRTDQKAGVTNPFEAALIEKLIDGITELTKTNVLLSNDGVQKHEVRAINLHASLVESIKQRDAEMGVTND